MNGKIIRKLIRIERLKYEVIKDVLPEKILHKLKNFEKEAIILIKDIGLDLMKESCEKAEEGTKQEIKKVKVDFL